jgi:hypothetical protein
MQVQHVLYAQGSEQTNIDSLLRHVAIAKEDTNQVNLLVKVMSYHIYYKQEEGLMYENPALQLAEELNWQKENKPIIEIRIGVHTGPVVAGIVGVRKFAYDIWGDTVNIASRMESSGEEGKVNISGRVYELVKDNFTCTYRGKIKAKNKGEIDMYFVDGLF